MGSIAMEDAYLGIYGAHRINVITILIAAITGYLPFYFFYF